LQYGLVNGAELILKQICGKKECNETNNTQILLNSPEYLIMELKYKKSNNNSLFENLNTHELPIFKISKTYNFFSNTIRQKISMTRKQFPISPAFAVTGYKVQGKTLDKVIIDLCPPIGKPLPRSYAYVAMTRCKTSNDLLILQDFPMSVLTQKPPITLLNEMNRLKE
jgi:hypothetical protein